MIINTGEKLKIEFNETEFLKKQLNCRVLCVEKDRFMLDYSEISPYYYQFLYEGQAIKLYYYSPGGVDIMDSIVITSPIEGKLEVEYPPDVIHVQRREYFRVPIELDVHIINEITNKSIIAKTVNLTANGVRVKTPEPLKFCTNYSIFLFFGDKNYLSMIGKVIKEKNKEEYVLEFTDIKDEFRDKIIKFCVQVQSKRINSKKNSLL